MFYIYYTGGRNARVAFSTFGMGIGAGDAFRLSSIAFEQEKASANVIVKIEKEDKETQE